MISLKERQRLRKENYRKYLQGRCCDLAIAIHRRTGWPLVAFIGFNACAEMRPHLTFEDLHHPNDVLHVAVRHPSGKILDIRGLITEKAAKSGFAFEITEVRAVTENDIRREFKNVIHPKGLKEASRLSREIWPRLIGTHKSIH